MYNTGCAFNTEVYSVKNDQDSEVYVVYALPQLNAFPDDSAAAHEG
jgi:hypothetical protein